MVEKVQVARRPGQWTPGPKAVWGVNEVEGGETG
jgi:hypothetical protein